MTSRGKNNEEQILLHKKQDELKAANGLLLIIYEFNVPDDQKTG
jgi:hypothetical protein